MLLAVDIGNTSTSFGLFENKNLVSENHCGTDKFILSSHFQNLTKNPIKNICVSSVVSSQNHETFQKISYVFKDIPILNISFKLKTGLTYEIDDPSEIGADRISNATAAHHTYKKDILIIDLGTATTCDLISENGVYLGGLIYPGIQTSFNNLFNLADKLSSIKLEKPAHIIGKNTEEHIRSGFYHGYTALIEGLIQRFEKEYGKKLLVIATGGFSPLFATATSHIHHVDPHLTLKGIQKIFELNH